MTNTEEAKTIGEVHSLSYLGELVIFHKDDHGTMALRIKDMEKDPIYNQCVTKLEVIKPGKHSGGEGINQIKRVLKANNLPTDSYNNYGLVSLSGVASQAGGFNFLIRMLKKR